MNGATSYNGKNGHKIISSESQPKWRESTSCKIDLDPCAPKPSTPKLCENTTKETYFLMNTEESVGKDSGSISKLAQLLLGLATLLALGSLLSNFFLVWAISKTTNTKEVTETKTTEKITRIIEKPSQKEANEYYYYAPAARW
jgi:hypothetical protein